MAEKTKLFNRDFLILLQAQTVSRLGIQVYAVAMQLWIKQATGSASLMGILGMVANLPGVLLGPFGGAIADRYPRRKILYLSDFIRGILLLILTAVVFLRPQAYTLIITLLFGVAIISASLSTVFGPALTAAIPDLVPAKSVAPANAFNQLSAQISVFLGQGLGGILFRVLGAPVLFLVNGLAALYASLTEFQITIPQVLPVKAPDWQTQVALFKADLLTGLRYIWTRGGLREAMIVSAFLSFFSAPIITLLPFFVEDILKVPSDWYGYILASLSVGALVGLLISGLRFPERTRGNLIMVLIFLNAVGYFFVGLVKLPVLALLLASLIGITEGFVSLSITIIVQMITPGEMRGRVFGLLGTLSSALAPIAMGFSGVVADLLNKNIPLIYCFCGAMMFALATWVISRKDFRRLVRNQSVE